MYIYLHVNINPPSRGPNRGTSLVVWHTCNSVMVRTPDLIYSQGGGWFLAVLWASCSHACRSATKQYNSVQVKAWFCHVPGKTIWCHTLCLCGISTC